MKGDTIEYRKGYKYQLNKDYSVATEIKSYNIDTLFIKLTPDGILTGRAGYAWDGASGPTIDTLNSMRGSLVHDMLYQLMREKLIPMSYREPADRLLKNICKEDGMFFIRAEAWFIGVDIFAAKAARSKTKIYTAPTGKTYTLATKFV